MNNFFLNKINVHCLESPKSEVCNNFLLFINIIFVVGPAFLTDV